MNQKSIAFFIISLACLSLQMSCDTSDEETISSCNDASIALKIFANIESDSFTRKSSLDSESFSRGDTIGLFILNSSNGAYNDLLENYNLPAVYNGSSFILQDDVVVTSEDAYIYAYYPYCSSFGNNFPNNASSGIQISYLWDGEKQIDILCSGEAQIANKDNPQVYLTFSHSLARVTFSFLISGYAEDAKLYSFDLISSTNYIPTNAWLYFDESIICGSLSDNQYLTDDISYDCQYAELSASNYYDIDLLVYPCKATGKTLSFVIDGLSYSMDLPTTQISEWQAGQHYTYTLNIKSSGYYGYEAVDLGLSVKWASYNVGANYPYECGDLFAWGETSSKTSYTNDNCLTYGDSFSDISGDEAFDAATANWGGGWRMPTISEIRELVSDCVWTWTCLNDVEGYIVEGSTGNSIFLPSTTESSGSFYWSSTPYDDNKTAQLLYFYSAYVLTDMRCDRGMGCCVRAVFE